MYTYTYMRGAAEVGCGDLCTLRPPGGNKRAYAHSVETKEFLTQEPMPCRHLPLLV